MKKPFCVTEFPMLVDLVAAYLDQKMLEGVNWKEADVNVLITKLTSEYELTRQIAADLILSAAQTYLLIYKRIEKKILEPKPEKQLLILN